MPFIEDSEGIRSKTYTSEVKTPVLVGVLVLAGIAILLFVSNIVSAATGTSFELSSSEQDTRAFSLDTEGLASSEAVVESKVYVFVSGAVKNPGVYKLENNARVGDAVEQAGGFLEGAATEYNNLARLLVDGEQIHVPLQSDLEQGSEAGSAGSVGSAGATGAAGAGATVLPQGASTSPGTASGLVNLNTATQAELETLPGIGPATAQKIIASRESEGPFSTPDELMRVAGIGEKKYAALEGLICV